MELIRDFQNLRKDDIAIAGGKGASLGEMTQAGILVPDGFVVLSIAFDDFLHETDLIQEIDAILEKIDHKAIHTIENASEKIRGLIESKEIPEDISKEIRNKFKSLNSEFVAVRSSATAEDGSEHAWAGQLESYLNTTGESLLENVRKCWSSLFTPRAIFYRFEKGLHDTEISVAVVVQKMIQSEISGIAFSVHPITEDTNQLIIEAGYGLGEAVVSGSITPDSYVVEKEPRKILDKNISEQKKAIFKSGDHNNWVMIDKEKRDIQKLSDEKILELSELVIKIENHYGFPCDIEWAFEKGKFYIVQNRPVTTLSKRISRNNFVNDIIKKFGDDKRGQDIIKQEGTFSLLAFSPILASGFHPFITKYYDFDFGSLVFLMKGKYGVVFFDIQKYVKTTLSTYQHFIKHKDINDLPEYVNYLSISEKLNTLYKAYPVVKITDLSNTELYQLLNNLFYEIASFFASNIFSEALEKNLIETLYNKAGGELSDFENFFVASTTTTFETLTTREKKTLVEFEKQTDPSNFLWLFMDYHDIPEIKDLPELFAQKIKTLGGIDWLITEIAKDEKRLSNSKNEAELYRSSLRPTLVRLFDFIKLAMKIRDERKIINQKALALVCVITKEVFNRINIKPEYSIYACMEDFTSEKFLLPEYSSEISQRVGGIVDYFSRGVNLFEYGNFNQTKEKINKLIEGNTSAAIKEISGNVGCKGKAKAYVRVILSEDDFSKFQEGEILVTSMTRPEFVPLMKKSKAIITDEGGVACHAAIVSRELNIPCIVGTKNATRILKDGDLVEVDADKGIVRIIERIK